MTFAYFDRVKETSVTVGTGALTLLGAVVGFRSFASVYANGDTFHYTIFQPSTGAWETGLVTWQTGNLLARTTVLDSSNGGGLVNFTAAVRDVFVSLPASVSSQLGAGQFAVQDLAARNAIPTAVLRVGMVVHVRSPSSFYEWTGSAWVVAPDYGPTIGPGTHFQVRAVQTRQLSTDGTVFGTFWTWNAVAGTWTAPVNGALPSPWTLFDSIVAPAVGDRVEVNADPANSNSVSTPKAGIFTITSLGSGGSPAVLTRATDLDSSADFVGGVAYDVLDGLTQKGTRRYLVTWGAITLNATPLQFATITVPSVHFVDLSRPPYNIRDWPSRSEWSYNDGADHFRAIDRFLWEYRGDRNAYGVLPTANGGHICGVKPFRGWGGCTLGGAFGKATIETSHSGGFVCVVQQLSPNGFAADGNPEIGPAVDSYAQATSLSSWRSAEGVTDAWLFWNLSHAGVLIDGWSQFECRMLLQFETLGAVAPAGHVASCRGNRVSGDVDHSGLSGSPFTIQTNENGSPYTMTATMRLTDTTAGVYGATVHTGGGAGTVVGHASVKPTEDCPNFTIKIHTGGTAGVAGVKIQYSPDGVNYRAPVALGTATDYALPFNEVNDKGLPFTAKVTLSGALVAGDTYKIPCSGVNQNVSLTSDTHVVAGANYDVCLQYRGGKVYFYVSPVGTIESGSSTTGVSATGVVKQRYWETTVVGRGVNAGVGESDADFNAARFYLGGIRFKSSSVSAPSAITSLFNNNSAVGAGVTGQKFCFVPSTDTAEYDYGGTIRSCYICSTEPSRDRAFLHPRSTRTGGQFNFGGFKNLAWQSGTDASQRASHVLSVAWTTYDWINVDVKNGNFGAVIVGPNFGSTYRDCTWATQYSFALDFFQGQLELSGSQNFQNGAAPCYLRAAAASVSAIGRVFANMENTGNARAFAMLSDIQGGGLYDFSCDAENQILQQCGSELIRISVADTYTWSLAGTVFNTETYAVLTQQGAVGEVALGKMQVTGSGLHATGLVSVGAPIPFVSENANANPFLVSEQFKFVGLPAFDVPECSRSNKWNKQGVAGVNVLADSNATVAWAKGITLKVLKDTWTANRSKTIGVVNARLGDIQEILLEPQTGFTTTFINGGAAGATGIYAIPVIPAGTFVRLKLRLDETFNWVSF